VFLAVWAFSPSLVIAQEPEVRVSSTAAYPLLIDGEEVARFPAAAEIGSQACVLITPGYLSEVERQSFQGWRHGPEDLCVTLTKPGLYTAVYAHELLLTVRSEVKDYRQSMWVLKGNPVRLEVPGVVEERPGLRYLFEEWTSGETRFTPDNTIVPNRPLTLEVRWTKEFFLDLAGPEGVRLVGGGWHRDRQVVVLKAPETVLSSGEDERVQFKEWEVLSNPALVIPNRTSPITSITMDDAHTIQAVYKTTYLVVVQNPLGTIQRGWFSEGEELQIKTEDSIEITPEQERLSFKSWEGVQLDSLSGFITVNQPMEINALYDRQFMVKVNSPYGVSGDGWYSEGKTARIEVPENPSSIVFMSKVFNGFDGYPDTGTTIQVPVTGPITITATYHTEIDGLLLGGLIGGLLAIVLIYFITQREYNRRKGRVRW